MAITSQDVKNALSPIIMISTVFDPPADAISLDGDQSITVDDFTAKFANATDMTAASLHAIDNGSMGYSTYIDEWKAAGYIS